MKRLSVLLSLALVLMLSVSSFAALSTNIKGFVETDLTYKKDDPDDNAAPYYLEARARAQVTLSMSAGSSGNPKVSVSMSGAATPDKNNWLDFSEALSRTQSGGIPFKISGWKLEATGAYWKDGPSLKTIVGSHNPNWNKYTAQRLGRNSIEVSGASVGPVDLKGIYSWTTADSDYNTIVGNTGALHASGKIDVISFNGYVTNYGPQTDSDNRYTNFTVDAAASPADGINLSGVFSRDSENEGSSYKAEAKVTTIPNFTITGLLRATDDKYNPRHTETDKDDRVWWPDEKVYKIGADTEQAGVKLNGSFQLNNKFSDADYKKTTIVGGAKTSIEGFDLGATATLTDTNGTKNTKTVVDASTKFADVTLKYKGTIETDKDMKNELEADTKMDLIFADGVKLNAKVILQGANDPQYGADAKWQLPNGIDFTVGYANYNKSGKDWVNGTGKDGFYLRAHKKVSF